MHAELPVLSFLCVALLAVFMPVRRVHGNVANLAIISWLAVCNLIHGINSLEWAGNIDMSGPIWCDIVTLVVLALNIALPGACVCIARELERVASQRKFSSHISQVRTRAAIDIFICYAIPLLYMALHYIVQDYRFDIVKDLGCFASSHPSGIASLILWLPPAIICVVSFIFSGLAVHHVFRQPSACFSQHISNRSNMNSSQFHRRLATVMITNALIFIFTLFSLTFVPVLKPWNSWAQVHAHVREINIVTESSEISVIQISWWGPFAITVVHFLLSLILGEETRDIFKWTVKKVNDLKKSQKFTLPRFHRRPVTISRSDSLSHLRRHQTIELKSGWDDMPEFKGLNRGTTPTKKTKTPASLTHDDSAATYKCASPSLSQEIDPLPFRGHSSNPSMCSVTPEDEVFMTSTLEYLGSPTAQSLGISAPVFPSPVYMTPKKAGYDALPTEPRTPSTPKPIPRSVPEDAVSVISSVFDAAWPVPPTSPLTPVSSRHDTLQRSRSRSPGDKTFGPLHPTVMPPRMLPRPFEGSSISSVSDISPKPVTRNTVPKRPSLRNLQMNWSGLRNDEMNTKVIHMTVVTETV
ncbi:pheromone A receptor-domain-containing protein [Cyathus striatus]|nr:pheromone A receptor-domain-containing protein [Cyathus striatus]